ncbi:Peptide-n4-(N-acetyl-beta-glucosaminyl)asparagine amidase A [Ceratobasidium theobromae]|uniref:Peptide-n4-(N-acetyl-beta-glucosaminyl)asparagine amidase A n=1 Tax=Ceratobasidium theobromae TaxID=1582974 RepID=A0A5N5QAF3_9AGAM|nr:Peptide-n4-(N-acetyl-beta-glucosaminyl)asparagine amidase A [Ceratobasidium theobromae]
MPAARNKKAANSSSSAPRPRARRHVWVLAADSPPRPPKKIGAGRAASTSASTSRTSLRASTAPNWNNRPEWVNDKPTQEWGKMCVERWCLLPPYDNRITETQWKMYYDERSALEKTNTMNSKASEAITPKELMQNTWKVLRKAAENVAVTILGCKLDDEQLKRISRTLIGSLYFVELAGANEVYDEPPPRHLNLEIRLYSPFGIGTSIDLRYDYHYRYRSYGNERNSNLNAALRTIGDCNSQGQTFCAAAPDPDNEDEAATANVYTIFVSLPNQAEDAGEDYVAQFIDEAELEMFEELLFGTKGWISPKKIADLLLAAGTVKHFDEVDVEAPERFKRKFKYFQEESTGKKYTQERKLLTELEKTYNKEHKGEAQQVLFSYSTAPTMKALLRILGSGVLLTSQATPIELGAIPVANLAQLDTVSGLSTPAKLASTLENGPSHLNRRVPLSTNDNTTIPLVDLQLLHPPPVPKTGTHCTIELLSYAFGNSYDAPAVVSYSPPTSENCGTVGKWGAVVGNLSSVYLDHVEIWRHSSAEPTKTGTVWTALKDLTPYTSLLSKPGTLLMDFSNILSADLGLDGVFYVTLTATFYSGALHSPTNATLPSEVILPLSNLSPNLSNYFAISDSAAGGVSKITIPSNTISAIVEIYCSGNSAEEFWYLNTPDEVVSYFSPAAGLVAKGPFREVQVLVDGKLAGVVWPFPVIYTGKRNYANQLASFGFLWRIQSANVDITPFLPMLTDSEPHNITLTVLGQGNSPPHSINANWYVSGNVRLKLGTSEARTTGKMTSYIAEPFVNPSTQGAAGQGNLTVHAHVTAHRKLRIESELLVGGSEKRAVVFEQDLSFENTQDYTNDGGAANLPQDILSPPLMGKLTCWIHSITQFWYFQTTRSIRCDSASPNFTICGYGSAVNQTFTRALLPPSGTAHTILWTGRAQGWVGMDDAPGLRHAINGTGETIQAFAYSDVAGETYFRRSHAKNDGWVEDKVWGTLASANPPVEDTTPGGGPGFRRRGLGIKKQRTTVPS